MLTGVEKVIRGAKAERLGLEGDSTTVSFQQALVKVLPNVQTIVTENLVERLRIVKDRSEIEATRVACLQAKRAYDVVRAGLTGNMTELEVAAELEYQARRFGAKALSFPPIVAVGPRGVAACHADESQTERKRLHTY